MASIIRPIEWVKEKFHSRYEISSTGCWEWSGYRNSSGYGCFQVLNEDLAHRVSFKVFREGFSKELCVLHKCVNPPCVNPDHLFLGSRVDNSDDKMSKGRFANGNTHKTHCKNGHELNEENTYIRKSGFRNCRVCGRIEKLGKYVKKRKPK